MHLCDSLHFSNVGPQKRITPLILFDERLAQVNSLFLSFITQKILSVIVVHLILLLSSNLIIISFVL